MAEPTRPHDHEEEPFCPVIPEVIPEGRCVASYLYRNPWIPRSSDTISASDGVLQQKAKDRTKRGHIQHREDASTPAQEAGSPRTGKDSERDQKDLQSDNDSSSSSNSNDSDTSSDSRDSEGWSDAAPSSNFNPYGSWGRKGPPTVYLAHVANPVALRAGEMEDSKLARSFCVEDPPVGNMSAGPSADLVHGAVSQKPELMRKNASKSVSVGRTSAQKSSVMSNKPLKTLEKRGTGAARPSSSRARSVRAPPVGNGEDEKKSRSSKNGGSAQTSTASLTKDPAVAESIASQSEKKAKRSADIAQASSSVAANVVTSSTSLGKRPRAAPTGSPASIRPGVTAQIARREVSAEEMREKANAALAKRKRPERSILRAPSSSKRFREGERRAIKWVDESWGPPPAEKKRRQR